MPKYRVYMQTTASTCITVDAEDEDAAIDAAYEYGTPSLCAYCSGYNQSHNLELGDDWEPSPDAVELVQGED
jgi:hypothetical protein